MFSSSTACDVCVCVCVRGVHVRGGCKRYKVCECVRCVSVCVTSLKLIECNM